MDDEIHGDGISDWWVFAHEMGEMVPWVRSFSMGSRWIYGWDVLSMGSHGPSVVCNIDLATEFVTS